MTKIAHKSHLLHHVNALGVLNLYMISAIANGSRDSFRVGKKNNNCDFFKTEFSVRYVKKE